MIIYFLSHIGFLIKYRIYINHESDMSPSRIISRAITIKYHFRHELPLHATRPTSFSLPKHRIIYEFTLLVAPCPSTTPARAISSAATASAPNSGQHATVIIIDADDRQEYPRCATHHACLVTTNHVTKTIWGRFPALTHKPRQRP